ncbi:MAG: hypothetical protein RL077_5105 [Verrucomicrobiota bacterium]|jgi:hypothetical protein
MPADSGLRRVLSSSLSICRTLNLREKSFTFLALKKPPLLGAWLQAGWSVSEKFPTPNSGARGRGLPPVQFPPPGTAEPFVRLIKPPVEGRKIFQAVDRRDYELENAVFLPVTDKSRFCGWGCIVTLSVSHARGDLSLRTLPLTESRADTDALLGGDDVDIRGVLVLVPGFPSSRGWATDDRLPTFIAPDKIAQLPQKNTHDHRHPRHLR